MKLTKEQRHLVYKELLKVVCKDPSVNYGMCAFLMFILDYDKRMPRNWGFLLGSLKMEFLPELNKHACRYRGTPFWAPLTKHGWEIRIAWIEQAIKDTKPSRKKTSIKTKRAK